MSTLDQHESATVVKALCVGDSGAGKTGALASLVDAGYNLRILDFDGGLSVLRGFVKRKENLRNVQYITLRDKFALMGAKMGIKKADAFQRGMSALDEGGAKHWGESGADVPPIWNWTPADILVLDTLATAGKSSLSMVLQANGQIMKAPEIQHYGTAMDNIEKLLDYLTSDAIGCHVIVNTHVSPPAEGSLKLYPEALGTKLGPKVAKPFDNMVSISVQGKNRLFKTKVDGLMALKTAKPLNDTYPIETGWSDIFKALLGVTVLQPTTAKATAAA
jgi:hypothetical protein